MNDDETESKLDYVLMDDAGGVELSLNASQLTSQLRALSAGEGTQKHTSGDV